MHGLLSASAFPIIEAYPFVDVPVPEGELGAFMGVTPLLVREGEFQFGDMTG